MRREADEELGARGARQEARGERRGSFERGHFDISEVEQRFFRYEVSHYTMQQKHNPTLTGNARRTALWWLLIAVATFTLYLFTLRLSPTLWHDEVMQLEWGRLALPGADASYGLGWLPEGRPFRMLAFLGCAVQELFCRLFDSDPAGHRIGSILGACLASFAMLGWLRARGVVPWIALACAVLLLWEPTFVQGYRGGRVDSFAIAFMLLALWAVVKGRSAAMPQWRVASDEWRVREQSDITDQQPVTSDSLRAPAWGALGWFALAGVCVAISGLMWVSAILLLPLLLHELWANEARGTRREARDATKSRWRVAGDEWRVREQNEARGTRLEARDDDFDKSNFDILKDSLPVTSDSLPAPAWRAAAWQTLVVALGAVVALGVLFLPVWHNLPLMLGDFLLKSPSNAGAVDLTARILRVTGQWGQSPWLPLAALLCLLWPPRWSQLAVFAIALVMMLYSGAYIHRGIYLLPYFLLAIATASSELWTAAATKGTKFARIGIVLAFGFMLAWSATVSLGARTFVALKQRESRDPAALLKLAKDEIGEGPHKVYLGEYEFYFAGRKMKWRTFRAFGWENWKDPGFLKLVSSMDHVIYRADNPFAPTMQTMQGLGFEKRRVTAAKTTSRDLASGRVRAAVQFGDYDVYTKCP